jgi:hypothetical protein
MFEIFGFIVAALVLCYVTFVVVFIGLCGGFEFSPLNLKNYWWYIPVVCGVASLWYLLLTNSPFRFGIT